jgi:predicted dehydrogenase
MKKAGSRLFKMKSRKMKETTRREFIRKSGAAGLAVSFPWKIGNTPLQEVPKGKRVGIIGLDTSHSPAFTKMFNADEPDPALNGYRVVAAYPQGSKDIPTSVERIPKYTEEVKALGVEIVSSISELLEKVDCVLLETNDGRPHLLQALPVLKAGKKLFVDKPVTASLHDAIELYEAAREYNNPIFSSSSLRYMSKAQQVRHENLIGKVTGAMAFSPASLEANHPDLFWYGIHGVETLFTVMGPGCKRVQRVHTPDTDVVIGTWADGRLGTFRGTRSGKHEYGGIAFGNEGNAVLGPYEGYKGLVLKIAEFFESGNPPVSPKETLEIYAFMEAADESKRQDGSEVSLDYVMNKARNS